MRRRDIAVCLILNNKHEFLLQKKTTDYKILPGGYWSFFGGEIEEGENSEETIKRELIEETGCEIKKLNLFKKIEYQIADVEGYEYIFSGFLDADISKISINEGAGFAFFEISELENIKITNEDKEMIKLYFREHLHPEFNSAV